MAGKHPIAFVFVCETTRSTAQVFADVIEIHIDGGTLTAAGPVFGRGVEHHLDLARVDGLPLNQRLERMIDVGNHVVSVTWSARRGYRQRFRSKGIVRCPNGQEHVLKSDPHAPHTPPRASGCATAVGW